MSSMTTMRRDSVSPGERLKLSGSMNKILIEGDVGKDAWVVVSGSMGEIRVGGYIHEGATVIVDGSMGKIFHNGKHRTATVEARGSMGTVNQMQTVGRDTIYPRPPKPSRPPTPPRLPRFPNIFDSGLYSSSSSETVEVSSVGKGHSVSIIDGQIFIDGEPVSKKVTADEVPPTEAEHGTVTVQKSHRPREQWGT